MFLAVCSLLLSAGCIALIFIAGGLDLWVYLVLGGTALLCFIYGLWKLNDETYCFSDLFDSLSRRLDERRAQEARSTRQVSAKTANGGKTEKPKKTFFRTGMENMKGFLVNDALLFGALAIYTLVYLFVISCFVGEEPIRSAAAYINPFGVILSLLVFGFCGIVTVQTSYNEPIFGIYYPVGRTVSETEGYIRRVFTERGFAFDIRRSARLAAYVYILALGIVSIFNQHALSLLVASPAFFISQFFVYGKDTYKDYIATVSHCKEWERYVCRYCGTLIGESGYRGKVNEQESEDYYRETTTTTTTTTTTYGDGSTDVDTDVDTRVQDYKLTHYSYDHRFVCPRCKRNHDLHEFGSYRTDL